MCIATIQSVVHFSTSLLSNFPPILTSLLDALKDFISRPVLFLGGAATTSERSINSDIKSPECLCNIPTLALTAQIL